MQYNVSRLQPYCIKTPRNLLLKQRFIIVYICLIAAFVLQYLTGIRVVSTRRFNCVVHGTFRLALTDKVKKECPG
jgi:hypothetical protein